MERYRENLDQKEEDNGWRRCLGRIHEETPFIGILIRRPWWAVIGHFHAALRSKIIHVSFVRLSPALAETARWSAGLVSDGGWLIFRDGYEHHGWCEHFGRSIPTIEGGGRRWRRVVHDGGCWNCFCDSGFLLGGVAFLWNCPPLLLSLVAFQPFSHGDSPNYFLLTVPSHDLMVIFVRIPISKERVMKLYEKEFFDDVCHIKNFRGNALICISHAGGGCHHKFIPLGRRPTQRPLMSSPKAMSWMTELHDSKVLLTFQVVM